MRNFIALAGALLLLSCGPQQPASVFRSPSGHHGPTGQIVGTVGVFIEAGNENPFFLNQLFFRSMDGNTAGQISFTETELASQETHFVTAEAKGSVFALELPAGKYEFYDIKFLRNDGGGQWGYRSGKEFSLPFAVVAGEASYLGSFVAYGPGQGSHSNAPTYAGQFRVSDQFERDGQLIADFNPDISADSIRLRLLQRMKPPLIVR